MDPLSLAFVVGFGAYWTGENYGQKIVRGIQGFFAVMIVYVIVIQLVGYLAHFSV